TSSQRIGTQNPPLLRPTLVALSWKFWNFDWLIGHLHIRLKTFRFAHAAAMTKGEKYEILVRFRPSAALMVRTGISLLSTVGSDYRGYFQICPFIATFRIIDNDAPSRRAIANGDVDELRNLFSK